MLNWLLLIWVLQEQPMLRHDVPRTLTMHQGEVLELYYVLESEDSILYVHAQSDDADLMMRAGFVELDGDDPSFEGKVPTEAYQDDDSGGGTTPYLQLAHRGGGGLIVKVAAKPGAEPARVTLSVFEMKESAETRLAAHAIEEAWRAADAAMRQGHFEESSTRLREAVANALLVPDHSRSREMMRRLESVSELAGELGDLSLARRIQEATLDVTSRIYPRDMSDLQHSRLELAWILEEQLDFVGARRLAEQVVAVFERTLPDDDHALQIARHYLASSLRALGELVEARRLEERVLETFLASLPEESHEVQVARQQLATILGLMGEWHAARLLDEQVLATRLNAAAAEQRALEQPGSVDRSMLEQSLQAAEREVERAKLNLAETLFELGELEECRQLQEDVLLIWSRERSPENRALIGLRANLAETLVELGEFQAAKRLEEEVLKQKAAMHGEGAVETIGARINLAGTVRRCGEPELARELLETCLEQLAVLGDEGRDALTARANLVSVLYELGDFERAQELSEAVLEGFRALDDPDARSDLQRARIIAAVLRAEAGDEEGARQLVRDVASDGLAAQGVVAAVGPGSIPEWVLGPSLSLSEGAGVFEPHAETELACFRLVERLKGRPGVLAAIRTRARGRERAARFLGEMHQWSSLPLISDDRLTQERIGKRQLFESLLESTQIDPPNPTFDASAIRDALQPGEVAVSFWSYSRWQFDVESGERRIVPHTLAWVVAPGASLRRIELGETVALERRIRAWIRDGLSFDAGRPLRERLIDPLAAALGSARRVWVSAAGELNRVPLDALPDGEGFLGDRREIVYVNALTDLTHDRPPCDQARAKQPGSSRGERTSAPTMLLLGDIDYGSLSAEEPSDRRESLFRGAAVEVLRESSEDPDSRVRFPALESSRAEVQAITETFHQAFDGAAESIVGEQATRQAFLEKAPRAIFLHLATHGWFAAAGPSDEAGRRELVDPATNLVAATRVQRVRRLVPAFLCGLAFAGANAPADELGRVPGILTAHELEQVDLAGVELAVLSACETSRGEVLGSQGVASLQAALHAAGVRSAITSLWRVKDEATRSLMEELYRRLWIEGESKAQALWNAKRTLREARDERGERLYDTSDWAGWVLSGDPD